MPRIIEKTVYSYGELSPAAKEAACQRYRETGFQYDWWQFVYEDAERVAAILGIEFDTKRGSKESAIYFSGFWSQGDGACFEGRYSVAKDATIKIREYAPEDTELHDIAEQLTVLQVGHKITSCGSTIEARVKHRDRYCHEHSTEISVTDAETGDSVDLETEEKVSELLRRFMKWIYRQLESEYEYLSSDEAIGETMEANEYEFDEDGGSI